VARKGVIVRGRTLPALIADRIRDGITDGSFTKDKGAKLLSEPELALTLGVSRSSLREAVALLESEGLIERRQGSGTFLRQSGALPNQMNNNFGVTDVIESAGRRAGSSHVEVGVGTGPARALAALGLPPGSRVITMSRVRTADGEPVADVVDILPIARLTNVGIEVDDLVQLVSQSESIYRALYKVGLIVHHGVAELTPVAATKTQAERLHVAPKAPLLRISQVDYLSDGDALVFSDEFHVADKFTMTIYRKGGGRAD
jgi:GntR family transcriptional regulator